MVLIRILVLNLLSYRLLEWLKRHLDPKIVEELLQKYVEPKQFGVLGQARVNVLQLNIALDQLQSTH